MPRLRVAPPMRAAWVLAALLLVPTASAWRVELAQPLGHTPRLADSLLLAGALNVSATDATFAIPRLDRADFGRNLTVVACPDVGGDPQDCRSQVQDAQANTHARIRVLDGGIAAQPSAGGSHAYVVARSGAAMLTGANLTANRIDLFSATLVGGAATLTTDAQALSIRPFGANVTLQVLGDSGTQTYNGSAVTLFVTGAADVILDTSGIAIGSAQTARVDLSEAPLPLAESSHGIEDLFALVRAVVPLDQADRRADLATAFGPFQIVPAAVNGAASARQNLTLNGAPQRGLVVVRLQDAQLQLANRTWNGSGNASFLVADGQLAAEPGAPTTFPLLIPVLLVGAAIVGRLLTRRVSPPTRARRQAALIRLGGILLLVILAETLFAALFGFHPIDAGFHPFQNWKQLGHPRASDLSPRSLVQTLLLVGSVAIAAYLAVGLATESLARSLLSWRSRANAIRFPAIAGLLAAGVFLLVSSAVLISVMARIVRL